MKKAVMIVSGGLDSATMLYREEFKYSTFVLTFDYSQRHRKEIECAKKLCNNLGLPHKIVDITSINEFISKGSLSGNEPVPFGHYASENMKKTIVPNRNMILLAIAVGYAATIEAEKVLYGAHTGDATIYPDCRKEFIKAIDSAVFLGNLWENNGKSIEIITPLIDLTKSEIVALGMKVNVPYKNTWTCYSGKEKACGKCGSCVERIEAFKLNGLIDPIEYEIEIDWSKR